jgi:peptidoglycan/LPS O-acetylase OafA/YrhL
MQQGKQGWHAPEALTHNNFDFFRFALAVLVIFSHSFALLAGTDAAEPLMRLTHQIPSGALAVDGFFMISGLLVTYSCVRSRTAGQFLRKRVARIYPGYILAMLVCGLVVAPLASPDPSRPFQPWELARLGWGVLVLRGDVQRYAFPHNPFPGTINGSAWTIPYEAWCYVGVLLLALAGLLVRRRAVLGLFLASLVASVLFDVYHWRPGGSFLGVIVGPPFQWARFLPYYLAGTTFFLYRDELPYSGTWAALAGVALVVGALVPHGLVLTLPTFGAYLLFWAAFHPGLPLQHWARHGDFSYGIYLYAFPIQQLLIAHLPGLRPLTLFALATPLTVLAGALSWYLVEQRFMARRNARHAGAGATVAEGLASARG